MIRAQSPSEKPPTPVPKAGNASERQPSSSATSRHERVVRRTRSASVRRSCPITAPWITHRARSRPAVVATALPSGIPPIAIASRSISSPPARLRAPATPAPIQSRSFAAFATASASTDAMSPSLTSSSMSEDAGAERRGDELDRELPGRVLAVEDRVDLDNVHRVDEAGLSHRLHREVRLAVREAAAHGSADAGGVVGVDDVHVEREVEERRAAGV